MLVKSCDVCEAWMHLDAGENNSYSQVLSPKLHSNKDPDKLHINPSYFGKKGKGQIQGVKEMI